MFHPKSDDDRAGVLSWLCALLIFQTRSRTGRRAFADSPRPGGPDRRDVRGIDGIRVNLPRPDRGAFAPPRPRVPRRYRSSRPEIRVRPNDPFGPRLRASSRRRRGGRAAEERGRAERRRARVVVAQPRRRHAERPRVAPARRSRRREQRHDLGPRRLSRRSRALGASARRGELRRGSRRAGPLLRLHALRRRGRGVGDGPHRVHAGGPAGRPRGVAARRVGADGMVGASGCEARRGARARRRRGWRRRRRRGAPRAARVRGDHPPARGRAHRRQHVRRHARVAADQDAHEGVRRR